MFTLVDNPETTFPRDGVISNDTGLQLHITPLSAKFGQGRILQNHDLYRCKINRRYNISLHY